MRKLSILLTIAAMFLAGCENEGDSGGKSKEAGGDPEVPNYTITLTDDGHGKAVATVEGEVISEAAAGEKVTITATPYDIYLFDTWILASGDAAIDDVAAMSTTFIMPEDDVEIGVQFVEDDTDVFAKIEDEFFREYSQQFDIDNDGILSLSEAYSVKEIDCMGAHIASLGGIEYFKYLEKLDCGFNDLRALDLSKNTKLVSLICFMNPIPSIDVSALNELTYLDCTGIDLSSPDLSNNMALTYLACGSSEMTSLDVSNHSMLRELWCGGEKFTSLDVSNCTALEYINIRLSKLSSLNLSSNIALKYLNCELNSLTSLDVSHNTALTTLLCTANGLTSLDISNNTALTYLDCYGNRLDTLDITSMAMNDQGNYTVYCGNQRIDKATSKQILLTMREDQKAHWYSTLMDQSDDFFTLLNYRVAVAE